jgi:hypothetical protein
MLIRIRIQGFGDQKLGKIYSWIIFFISKIAIYLSLGLQKGCPSYRRSLQSSKENIQHFKTLNFLTLFYLLGHFCPPESGFALLDPDPDPVPLT